ncbi:hypothetical protein F5148DRAFT_211408 [Russula earlei]|uniref:Uncharacterized protein n=1 Tax=Russula earlei TaxID=71964 RepID=A0ACC0U4I1_9AGAM|nr:hypothetical protein F5148DRAFT_211408 [Russula earlei]
MPPRRAYTHPGIRPKATSTTPALIIKTGSATYASESSDRDSRTSVPLSKQRQHRWSELVPPQTALTFVAMYDPAEGLLTFSGASLLPSEPPTPPTPQTPALDTPVTPTTYGPMPCTPAPSTLADMQSLLDAYFRSAAAAGNNIIPARASSTFDGLFCVGAESGSIDAGCFCEKPLPMRPPPPPDRDSVFAWSWLGRIAQEDPREPWDASGNEGGRVYWPSVSGPGCISASCDGPACKDGDDDDSFFFTPPEIEDPNECSAFSVTTTSTSEYIDVPGHECDSIWSANVLAYAYPARTHPPRRQARTQMQTSSPTSPAQALLHPWRLLRARTSQATITGTPQRRASKAASMFAKLGRLGSRDDGESWICVEVVHTITQRPLRECDW